MEVIVGAIIMNKDKILMVKEAKEKCFSKWSFPAGHIENNETIFDCAKRESLEETGYEIKLKKTFPIFTKNTEDISIIMIHFLAKVLKKSKKYNTNEILEIKWMPINELKKMKKEEFRSYTVIKKVLESIENKCLYPINMINDMPYI